MKLTEATPEQIKKMGENYAAPLTDGKVRRPNARRISALELILTRSKRMTAEQFSCLSTLQNAMLHCTKEIGLTSSYGDQRWNGTPVHQLASLIDDKQSRSVDYNNLLKDVEFAINHPIRWGVMIMILRDDKSLKEVGYALGEKTDDTAKKKGADHFWKTVPVIVHCMTHRRHDYG